MSLGKMNGNPLLAKRRISEYPFAPDVAMWDGIDDAGIGSHVAAPRIWRDLTDNGHDFIAVGNTALDFGADHYAADGTKYLTATLGREVTETVNTIEVVLKMDWLDAAAVYETLMCLNSDGFRIAANTNSPEVGSRGFSMKGDVDAHSGVYSALHMQQPCSYAFTFGLADPMSVSKTYLNGEALGANSTSVGFTNTVAGLIPKSYRDKNFKGRIYRVALHSRLLTATEVAANYAVDKASFKLP